MNTASDQEQVHESRSTLFKSPVVWITGAILIFAAVQVAPTIKEKLAGPNQEPGEYWKYSVEDVAFEPTRTFGMSNVRRNEFEARLNSIGNLGEELVAVVPIQAVGPSSERLTYRFIFKKRSSTPTRISEYSPVTLRKAMEAESNANQTLTQ